MKLCHMYHTSAGSMPFPHLRCALLCHVQCSDCAHGCQVLVLLACRCTWATCMCWQQRCHALDVAGLACFFSHTMLRLVAAGDERGEGDSAADVCLWGGERRRAGAR